MDEGLRATEPDNNSSSNQPVHERQVYSVDREAGRAEWRKDHTAGEFPLTIFVNDVEMATLVCTPTNLRELVRGFLTAEGVLRRSEEITRFFIDREEGTAHVDAPRREGALEQEQFGKRYVGSCCGKSRTGFYFANDARTAREVDSGFRLSVNECFELMDRLQNKSPMFSRTGGVHNAALSEGQNLLVTRTDIGRHNTLDKLYGHALSGGRSLSDCVVVFSGRLSSEIILKVSKMQCPMLITKSAPTELALRMAGELGIATAGFVRGRSLNVYTCPKRFEDVPAPVEERSGTTLSAEKNK